MDEALLTRVLKFLSHRPRSEKEITDNLKKKNASAAQIETILIFLREKKFVNDYDFAVWWIESRRKFRPKGWYVLVGELRQKGISAEIIRQIGQAEKDIQQKTERQLVMQLIQKQMKKYHDLPASVVYRRLGGFLSRRGFSGDVIKACIDEIFRK